jgi:uncharacterized membrane protein
MCTWWELASWMPLFVVSSLPTTLGLVTTQNSRDLIVTTKIHVEPHFTKGKMGNLFGIFLLKNRMGIFIFIYLFIYLLNRHVLKLLPLYSQVYYLIVGF